MPDISGTINGVAVEFSPSVNKSVDQKIIDALKLVIRKNIVKGKTLSKIYISSANDQHKLPSRHVQGTGKAVDVSRVNGMRMSEFYKTDSTVKAITNAIQNEFEKYPHRRENFGPYFKKKLGKPAQVSGHGDHRHMSVN